MSPDQMTFPVQSYRLIPLECARAEELADYQQRNRERFRPFSPARTDIFYTTSYWKSVRRRSTRERRQETALRWVLVDEQQVIAQISMDQIVRGAFQSAVLGYALDGSFEGQGLMTQSLQSVIDFSFRTLNLHRLSANHIPENERSARVLARLGFEREGLAKSYLRLNGVWCDHVLNSLLNPRHR